jgi:hypothetical protein
MLYQEKSGNPAPNPIVSLIKLPFFRFRWSQSFLDFVSYRFAFPPWLPDGLFSSQKV